MTGLEHALLDLLGVLGPLTDGDFHATDRMTGLPTLREVVWLVPGPFGPRLELVAP